MRARSSDGLMIATARAAPPAAASAAVASLRFRVFTSLAIVPYPTVAQTTDATPDSMDPFRTELILAGLYLLLGPGAWLAFGFAMVKGRKRMRLLSRPRPELPEPAPRVTVLLPAKDEAARVERCVATILAQDYPNFELVAIDDRSGDGTGRILDDVAARDPRVRVVHVRPGELPAGWGGKSH